MSDNIKVRSGQIWADNEPRSASRTARVDMVVEDKAHCRMLTNSDKV